MSSRSPICATCSSASSPARPGPTSSARCSPGRGKLHRTRPPSISNACGAPATLTEKTKASLFGDWFRTGDIGHLDAEGFLYLTDRKKDIITSGGENIASSEVERVVYEWIRNFSTAVQNLRISGASRVSRVSLSPARGDLAKVPPVLTGDAS